MSDITIVYCADPRCDEILATGSLALRVTNLGHASGGSIHQGGLFLRVTESKIDRASYKTVDDFHKALRGGYAKKDHLSEMTNE